MRKEAAEFGRAMLTLAIGLAVASAVVPFGQAVKVFGVQFGVSLVVEILARLSRAEPA